jgi:hypothetical protein
MAEEKPHPTGEMTLEQRVERLERVVAQLAQRHGYPAGGETAALVSEYGRRAHEKED